eukprot:scaffold29698_cov30-Prasinocladus_malaysianus.AAC.1
MEDAGREALAHRQAAPNTNQACPECRKMPTTRPFDLASDFILPELLAEAVELPQIDDEPPLIALVAAGLWHQRERDTQAGYRLPGLLNSPLRLACLEARQLLFKEVKLVEADVYLTSIGNPWLIFKGRPWCGYRYNASQYKSERSKPMEVTNRVTMSSGIMMLKGIGVDLFNIYRLNIESCG